METAYLIRNYHKDHTAGIFTLTDGNKVLFTCNTMELPDRGNERRVSCIPTGTYKVVPYSSPKFKSAYHILNVPNRDAILIHPANTVADLLGCIGVGIFSKIGTISESRTTLARLKKAATSFNLVILDGIGERGIESIVIPEIVTLLGSLAPSVIHLLSGIKSTKGKRYDIIAEIMAGDKTEHEKVLLIDQILKL